MPPTVAQIQAVFDKQVEHGKQNNRTVSVTYSGTTKNGIKGGVDNDSEWQIQGYKQNYDTSVWVKTTDFPEFEDKQSIQINGNDRRILGVHPDGMGALTRLDIGEGYA